MGRKAKKKEYLVEKIVDHVTYDVAYREFYEKNNKSFENMFGDLKGKKKVDTSKIHYQIKWLDWDGEEMTWEAEENCTGISYFQKYKAFNGIGQHERMTGTVNFDKYEPLNMKTIPAPSPRGRHAANQSQINLLDYEFFIYDIDYNAQYGIVKNTEMKVKSSQLRTKKPRRFVKGVLVGKQKYVIFEKFMSFLKPNERPLLKPNKEKKLMEFIFRSDSSYLANIISHPNIIKCKDLFVRRMSDTRIKLTYVWEHLDKRMIHMHKEGEMLASKIVDLTLDMLTAFALLHTYGVHANLTMRSIYYHNGKFKIGDMENFVLQTSISDINYIKRENIVYAPRRFGLDAPFDFTVDYHALGLIVLQCLANPFENDNFGPMDLTQKIADKMRQIPMIPRHFVQLCLQARDYIHRYKLPQHRFSARSLKLHPFVDPKIPDGALMTFVHFMYSEESLPIEEILYYTYESTVDDLLEQLTQIYYPDGVKPHNESLIMLALKGFATQVCPRDIVCGEDNFHEFVLRDVSNYDLVVKRITEPLPTRTKMHEMRRRSSTAFRQYTHVVSIELDPTNLDMHPERFIIVENEKYRPIEYDLYDYLLDQTTPPWLPPDERLP